MSTDFYRGTYVIVGPPGTGKTRAIAESVRRICERSIGGLPALVCSLTRAAAREAAGRIDALPRDAVGTLHSHAYRALEGPEVAEVHADEWNAAHPNWPITGADRDAGPFVEAASLGDELLAEVGRRRGLRIDVDRPMLHPRDTDVRAMHRAWEAWKRETGHLDFTDLIEVCLRDVARAPGDPGVILVDEAQDFSTLEFDLALKWGGAASAVGLVGDMDQSLFVWRGADPARLDVDVPAGHRGVLDKSYRVPAAVHRVACAWRAQVTAHTHGEFAPRDGDAGFAEPFPASWTRPQRVADWIEANLDGETVMVEAACGYMLDPIVQELRARGVPFCNPRRTRNGRWNPLRQNGRGISTGRRLAAFLGHRGASGAIVAGSEDGTDFEFGANVPPAESAQEAFPSCPESGSQWGKQHFFVGHAPTHGVRNALVAPWSWRQVAAFSELLAVGPALLRGARARIEAGALSDPDGYAPLADVFAPEAVAALAAFARGDLGEREALAWFEAAALGARRDALRFPLAVARRSGVAALTSPPRVYVGTVHSFKGFEAGTCFLFPDVSPRGWQQWRAGGEGRDAVVRTFYVGMTRARDGLFACDAASEAAVNFLR